MTIRMLLRIGRTLLVTAQALAQPAAKPDDEQPVTDEHRWLQDYFLKQARQYEFFCDDARSKPLTFVEKPIFRWKQDDDWRGDLFVWTYQGRPEVVGTILASSATDGTRGVGHEFHTLAPQALPRAKTVSGGWQPKSGLKMTPFTDVEPPARTAALRLSQMRAMARDFTVTMKNDERDWELRWLPQPIYRFAAPELGVIDGGLFAFVWTRGTDPEMLLLLECRDDKPESVWTYAPLEFTTRPLRLTFREREVWTAPGGGGWISGESTKPYETFYAGRVTVPSDER